MIEYRVAAPDDFEALLLFFKEHHEKSIYSVLDFSVGQAIESFTYCYLNPKKGRVFIAVNNGKIVGACLSVMRQLITSKDLIAQETGLAVEESVKGEGIATALIEDFSKWGRDNGAKMLMTNSSLGIDNERANGFFKKSGFNSVGVDFARVI